MTPAQRLERGLEELALQLPQQASEALLRYVELLAKWNNTFNLTAVRDPGEMISRHVLDSLAVLPYLPLKASAPALADVGSGAGLPGIPLAIARPHWTITLNDSRQKKVAFLRQASIELRLSNVRVHEGRAESWRPASPFALVISRAFAELDRFAAVCRHLLAPGGVLVAMRGTAPERLHEGELVALKVPFLDAARHLVLLRPES